MSNIYVKQMQQLGLNPKQYAELIDIPYEVVKNFIYGKEGEYEMGLGDLLRKNMFSKHQEVERNIENAKIKAAEIKYQSRENPRDWYENVYTPELLLNTLKLKTRVEFERNYDIILEGERASKWFYNCLTGKTNYDNHEINYEKQAQFIEQLYDILVNGNVEKYKRETPIETKIFPTERRPIKNGNYKNKYFKWFADFNLKQYMKENGLRNEDLCKKLGVGVTTVSHLINKRHYTKRTLQKLYNFVNANIKETKPTVIKNTEEFTIPIEPKEDDINVITIPSDKVIRGSIEYFTEKKEPETMFTKHENNIENTNNDLLKKILKNRLTEEEKELIKIFGGVID
jgi:transcriptional regulator with XRE-family HTH domain